MATSPRSVTAAGVIYALAAYGAWGLSPLFWKHLAHLPDLEVLGHRVVWAMVVFFTLLVLRGRLRELQAAYRDWRYFRSFLASAALIGVNWYLYVWAVNHEHILQASLGYFINPLFNVLLGMVFLGERLRPWQWVSVALAAVGVTFMTTRADHFPWIALTLVATFGLYGLVRKISPADALLGSNLETSLLAPVALLYLVAVAAQGEAVFTSLPATTLLFLLATGFMTALPLLWFSNAARRLPLTTLGFFQYLAPTGQFVLAVLVYDEPFSRAELMSFLWIWAALALFSFEAHLYQRRRRRQRVAV